MANRKLPFGYHIRSGQIQIAEHEADAVRMIFDCYIAGMSYNKLTDKLNGQDIPYVPGKPWNKNMVARVLQDERYVGDCAYPQIITSESFRHTQAVKPDFSSTVDCAEIKYIRILARCGLCNGPMRRVRKNYWLCPQCMNSPASIKDSHLILSVDRLLRTLYEHPETVVHTSIRSDDEAVQCAQDSFIHELDKPEFDESAAMSKAIALANAKLNTLTSGDYETMRIQYILRQAKPHDGLDTSLLRQIVSAILIYPTGAVSLRLKNNQSTERSDST